LRTWKVISEKMADPENGGYFEIMQRDWKPERPGRYGGDRKSMDVHMHMMEALTTLYEMTGDPDHLAELQETIGLIVSKMLHPDYGTGYIQFSLDFKPLAAIMFDVEWGRDADPEEGQARPLDYTSYGHNVEFIWLLLHAADIMKVDRSEYAEVTRKIVDHCLEFGIDREFGGVFVEGPHNAAPTITEKQFWQQAEVLVGLLDACALFGDEKYWEAFESVYQFVFTRYVNMDAGGEWFAYEWLADLVFARTYGAAGWHGVLALSALVRSALTVNHRLVRVEMLPSLVKSTSSVSPRQMSSVRSRRRPAVRPWWRPRNIRKQK